MPALLKTLFVNIALVGAGMLVVGVPATVYIAHLQPSAQAPVATATTTVEVSTSSTPAKAAPALVVAPATVKVYFNGTGSIASIAITAGKAVTSGQTLFTITHPDIAAQLTQAKKDLSTTQAKLKSLSATSTVAVSLADQNALANAQNKVRAAVRNAYITSNDAISNKAASLFSNPKTNAKLNFTDTNSQAVINLNATMSGLEGIFPNWQKEVLASSFDSATNTAALATEAEVNLKQMPTFLSDLAGAVDTSPSLSSSAKLSDKSMLSTGQLAISNALSAVIAAETDEQEARAAITVDTAGQPAASAAAIKAQQTAVNDAQTKVKTLTTQMATSTVKAAATGTISSIAVHEGDSVTAQTLLAVIVKK